MKNLTRMLLRETAQFIARLLFVFPILPMLYLIEPFWRIRFGVMYTQRIGHLAGNTDIFLRKQQLYDRPSRTSYIFAGWAPANQQLMTMFKRQMPVYESRWLTRIFSYWYVIHKHTRFFENLAWSNHNYREFTEGRATLTFTAEEEARGQAELKKMGLGENDWFVCLHTRDSAYLNAWRPQYSDLWKTREFRNGNIENCLEAAEYITSQGGFVIRMGAVVEKPLPDLSNPKIIDYASKHRSDFMDIYLAAKTRFFLGTNSGFFVVATIFDRPVALVNMVPYGAFPFHRDDLYIAMLLKNPETQKIVTFDEAVDMGYYDVEKMFLTELHADRGFEWVENSPDEILELTREMIARQEGQSPTPKEVAVRNLYRDKFMALVPDNEFAGDIGYSFANKYRHLIEHTQS
ncbi:MAG: TIGR04372 family glycosyltransferase [Rhodospirillaceae bacterium]|nr:TIGR04372 family glycosyltransferase [Rhodospirillaceae bacterium]